MAACRLRIVRIEDLVGYAWYGLRFIGGVRVGNRSFTGVTAKKTTKLTNHKNLFSKVRIMSPVTIIHPSNQNSIIIPFFNHTIKPTISLNEGDEMIKGNQ